MKQSISQIRGNYLFDALLEIIGVEELSTLDHEVRYKGSESDQSKIIDRMITKYGENLARGMLIRAGRAGFYYWMRGNAEQCGWSTTDFRLLPTRTKIKRGLNDLVTWWQDQKLARFSVENTPEEWQIDYQPIDPQRTGLYCCYFLGIFQEFFSWAGSGKFYPAVESECGRGVEKHHFLNIAKQPLD
jgi:hypothetical protein